MLENDNVVCITITNGGLKYRLEELKPEIIKHLSTQLQNDFISLKLAVREVENNVRKLYTSQDKFNYLAEKYPNLLLLKNKLGLELE
jgi:DNA polymerase-3 subunit gamma/tau